MQVVALNTPVTEVVPREGPPVQTEETESPPTPLPRQHADENTVGEISRAAAHHDPEVSVISQG